MNAATFSGAEISEMSLRKGKQMHWRYEVIPSNGAQANVAGSLMPIPRMLDALGSASWELVCVVPTAPNVFEFVFKQPVP